MNKKYKIIAEVSLIIFLGFPISFYFMNLDNFLIITSDSMVPTIHVGDLIYYEYKDPSKISANSDNGDILVLKGLSYFYEHGVDPFLYNYTSGDIPVVHRAINRVYNETENKYFYETFGDNNLYSDGCGTGNYSNGYGVFIINISNPILIPETEIMGVVRIIIPLIGNLGINFNLILLMIPIFLISLSIYYRLVSNFKIKKKKDI